MLPLKARICIGRGPGTHRHCRPAACPEITSILTVNLGSGFRGAWGETEQRVSPKTNYTEKKSPYVSQLPVLCLTHTSRHLRFGNRIESSWEGEELSFVASNILPGCSHVHVILRGRSRIMRGSCGDRAPTYNFCHYLQITG